jgi:hypothetical protein
MTLAFNTDGAAFDPKVFGSDETSYVSGPMTALKNFNFDTFDSLRDHLCNDGDTVYSPADHDRKKIDEVWPGRRPEEFAGYPDGDLAGYFDAVSHGGEFTLDNMMRWDFNVIANDITRIVMLPGWEKSTGARYERVIAEALNIPVWLARFEGNGITPGQRWHLTLDENQDRLTQVLKHLTDLVFTDWREEFVPQQPHTPEYDPPILDGERLRQQHQLNELLKATSVQPNQAAPGEVRITDPITGGQKGSKSSQLSCAPPEGLRELGKVFAMGAAKYERHNFRKGYAWSLSADALLRHVIEWIDGNDLDDESGLNHLAHAAWHCLNLIQYTQDHPELDDRWKG